MRPTSAKRIFLVVTAVAAMGSARHAEAQLKGHYIPGFTGMQNGSQAPPGISLFAPGYFFTTDTLKNDDGDELGAHPRINASFVGLGVAWVTNVKLLGGNLGGNVVPVAFMKSRIESNSLEVPGSFAFTDISVTPLQLGWTKPRADFTVAYTFFAPTGKWEEGGAENSGLGMWSNLIQAGSTLRLDDKHAWTTSLLASYELHSHKEDSTLKVGDVLTLEGGTGKSFFKKVEGTPLPRITTVGLAYYAQLKVSADSGIGPVADRLVAGRKDRVFGLGVEGSVFLPKPKLVLGLRFVPEFGARNRPQGYTFLLTVAYEAKSLVKMPAAP
jgi:hypothetical protein